MRWKAVRFRRFVQNTVLVDQLLPGLRWRKDPSQPTATHRSLEAAPTVNSRPLRSSITVTATL